MKQACDENSLFYSESGLSLVNCEWNEYGKSVKFTVENGSASVSILGGPAWDTTFWFYPIFVEENTFVKPNEEFEENVAVSRNSIFVKCDGENVNDYQFYRLLEIDDDWTSIEFYTDVAEQEIIAITHAEMEEQGEELLSNYGLGNIYQFVVNKNAQTNKYDVYQMGNVYINEGSYDSGVIDIQDVMYLRQAIVGREEALEDHNFKIEASDVNFSNDRIGTIGDVGDILAIRERILNGTW